MTPPKHVSFDAGNYTGRVEETLALEALLRRDPSIDSIPVTNLFIAHYHAYPCTVIIQALPSSARIHVPTLRRYLEIDHKHDSAQDIVKRQYHPITRSLHITDFLADLGHGIMLDCEGCQLIDDVENPNKYSTDGAAGHFLVAEKVRVNYLPQQETYVNGELASRLSSFYILPSHWKMIQVVYPHSQKGYYVNKIKIKKPIIYDLSISYSTRLVTLHRTIIRSLLLDDWKGLILLHGTEGTGKTYYIRYLINELASLPIICLPVDTLHHMSSADFLQLLRPDPDCILIVDDAENLNKDDHKQAVDKLYSLNEFCFRPIIAAFNCDLQQTLSTIKTAKIVEYSFEKLNNSQAQMLLKTLGSQRTADSIQQPMSLAEIYAQRASETKAEGDQIRELPTRLKTPEELIQNIAEHELTLTNKDSCTLS